ncbi:MAG: hypothetical protein OXQ31_10820 [Spirochaetaceae bacterium]|nr:hypothetical protein [Spirochaetaceae bacterium]
MRIAIDASVANDADSHQWLDRILAKIEDRWHVWDLTGDRDVEAISTSTWCLDPGRQGVRVKDMLVAATKLAAWTLEPHERRLRVTAYPNAHDELAAETACRLAETPLEILVENRDSDGAFVRRIIEELDPDLAVLWRNPTEPIRFDSVGGKGQMAQAVRNRTCGPRPTRLVAVIDSDRKGSNDQASGEARALRRACKQGGQSCWVLAKREAENYLTKALLVARPDTGADHRQRVAAWDRLSDDQKNFFDMKEGWSKTLPRRSRTCSTACRTSIG